MDRATAELVTTAALEVAKITLPFRALAPPIKKYVANVKKVWDQLQETIDRIEQLRRTDDGDDALSELPSAAFDWYQNVPFAFSRPMKPLQEFIGEIEWTLPHVEGREVSVTRLIERFERFGESLTDLFSNVVLRNLDSRYLKEITPEWEAEMQRYYPDGYFGKEDVAKAVAAVEALRGLVKGAQAVVERLEPLRHGKEEMPKSEKVETLYHATIAADAIKAKGFDPKPTSTKGLGGSNTDKCGNPGISFTSDLYVAKEVMRGLKEAILIANGKVRLRHILDWAERGGFTGIKDTARKERWKDNPRDTFEAYKLYMGLAGNMHNPFKRKRYDPAFFGSSMLKALKGENPRKVGIVVAKVNMADPCISYFRAMEEYRVHAGAVLDIVKVIKG